MRSFIILFAVINIAFGLTISDVDYHPVKRLVGAVPGNPKGRFFEDVGNGKPTPVEEMDPEFWRMLAREELDQRLVDNFNYKQAKNIIFFLGDGMSLTTLTASRIRKGQLKGNTGEEDALSFQKFPHSGLSRVRSITRFLQTTHNILLFQ